MVIPSSTLPRVDDERLTGAHDAVLAASRSSAGRRGTVLFAHGFGQTRHAWTPTALSLAAAGYQTLAYDARGHGDSDWNPADLPYHGEQFADDLIVLAGEQPQPPILVAASMGGLFGLLAESRWPGLFSAMVLVDITPRWDTAGVERILMFMTAHPDGFASLAQAADVISAYMPHRPRKSEDSLRALALGPAPGRRTGARQRTTPGRARRSGAPGQMPGAAGQRRPQHAGHPADGGRIPRVGAACAPCAVAGGHPYGRR